MKPLGNIKGISLLIVMMSSALLLVITSMISLLVISEVGSFNRAAKTKMAYQLAKEGINIGLANINANRTEAQVSAIQGSTTEAGQNDIYTVTWNENSRVLSAQGRAQVRNETNCREDISNPLDGIDEFFICKNISVKLIEDPETYNFNESFSSTNNRNDGATTADWTGDGQLRLAQSAAGGTWRTLSDINAPPALKFSDPIWTGSAYIIWGGQDMSIGSPSNKGAVFDNASEAWSATDTADPDTPDARQWHTAVWTGTEMIIWGGSDSSYNYLNSGARYNPATDSWQPMTTTDAPTARINHAAVWTGDKMVVWGGGGASTYNTGGIYDPVADSWTSTPTTDAPSARVRPVAIWTGDEVIIWGERNSAANQPLNDGKKLSNNLTTWTDMTVAPIDGRAEHSTVWTGTEMIIWGGCNWTCGNWAADAVFFNDGAIYTPATDSWQLMAPAGPKRRAHSAAWTGSAMIMTGGRIDPGGDSPTIAEYSLTARSYDPLTDTWTDLPDIGASRKHHFSYWDGDEVVVDSGYLITTARYQAFKPSTETGFSTPNMARSLAISQGDDDIRSATITIFPDENSSGDISGLELFTSSGNGTPKNTIPATIDISTGQTPYSNTFTWANPGDNLGFDIDLSTTDNTVTPRIDSIKITYVAGDRYIIDYSTWRTD